METAIDYEVKQSIEKKTQLKYVYILSEKNYFHFINAVRRLTSEGFFVINRYHIPNHKANIQLCDAILPMFNITDEDHEMHDMLIYALNKGKTLLSRKFFYLH
jgi:hypothetical protein